MGKELQEVNNEAGQGESPKLTAATVQQFLRSLFTWHGRIGRRRFCYCFFGFIVLTVAINRLCSFIAAHVDFSLSFVIFLLVSLTLMGAMLCQMILRYHDFGVTGWVPGGYFLFGILVYLLISPLMPLGLRPSLEINYYVRLAYQVVGYIVMLFVPALLPGNKSDNKYGAPPRHPMLLETSTQ